MAKADTVNQEKNVVTMSPMAHVGMATALTTAALVSLPTGVALAEEAEPAQPETDMPPATVVEAPTEEASAAESYVETQEYVVDECASVETAQEEVAAAEQHYEDVSTELAETEQEAQLSLEDYQQQTEEQAQASEAAADEAEAQEQAAVVYAESAAQTLSDAEVQDQQAQENLEQAEAAADEAGADESSVTEAEQAAQAAQEELDAATAEHEQAQQALDDASEAVDEADAERDAAERELEERTTTAEDAAAAREEARANITKAEDALQRAIDEQSPSEDVEAARAVLREAEADLARAEDVYGTTQEQVSSAEQVAEDAEQDVATKQVAHERAQEELVKAQQEDAAARRETEQTADIVAAKKAALDEALQASEGTTQANWDLGRYNSERGSLGFFEWMAEQHRDEGNSALAARSDAAVRELTGGSMSLAATTRDDEGKTFLSYVNLGDAHDATGLENMRRSIELLQTANQRRALYNQTYGLTTETPAAYDQYGRLHTYLEPLRVDDYLMAVAQIQLDWSSTDTSHIGHAAYHGSPYNVGENLSWGYADPYVGWYDEERAVWEDAVRTDTTSQVNYGDVGHYFNLISYDANGITGAAHTSRGPYRTSDGQVFDTQAVPGASMSVDEYAERFTRYYNAVKAAEAPGDAGANQNAVAEAQAAYQEALDRQADAQAAQNDAAARLAQAQANADATKTALDRAFAAKTDADVALAEAEAEARAADAGYQQALERYAAASEAFQQLTTERDIRDLEQAVSDAHAALEEATRAAAEADAAVETARAAKDAAVSNSDAAHEAYAAAEAEARAASARLGAAQSTYDDLQGTYEELRDLLAAAKDARSSAAQATQALSEARAAKQAADLALEHARQDAAAKRQQANEDRARADTVASISHKQSVQDGRIDKGGVVIPGEPADSDLARLNELYGKIHDLQSDKDDAAARVAEAREAYGEQDARYRQAVNDYNQSTIEYAAARGVYRTYFGWLRNGRHFDGYGRRGLATDESSAGETQYGEPVVDELPHTGDPAANAALLAQAGAAALVLGISRRRRIRG